MTNKQGTEKEIIHISDGNLTPCDFCGVSFSHKHKAGSLPKEFEMIEDKSQADTPEVEKISQIDILLTTWFMKSYKDSDDWSRNYGRE